MRKKVMRPYIICHMGTSIDGRLHPSRFTSPAKGISRDVLRGHYERVHDQFGADGWIVGRRIITLLLEGGGKINGAFLKHKLIDEFSTLIHPAIDGLAGVQSIVDYDGHERDRPGAGQSLSLTHCETLEGGMVWLRHAVERAPD